MYINLLNWSIVFIYLFKKLYQDYPSTEKLFFTFTFISHFLHFSKIANSYAPKLLYSTIHSYSGEFEEVLSISCPLIYELYFRYHSPFNQSESSINLSKHSDWYKWRLPELSHIGKYTETPI